MAELSEQRIYSVFGLEPPSAANGANEQGAAAPAAQGVEAGQAAAGNGSTGATEQGIAAPAAEPANPDSVTQSETGAVSTQPDEPADDAAEGSARGDNTMSTEQRRQNAARRREAEQLKQQQDIADAVQQAVQAEKQKNAAAMEAFFKQAGLKNTITGQPITNMDEFNAWQSAFSASRLEQNLKAGKLTKEDLAQIVAENPAVKQAEEVIRKSQEAERQVQRAQDKARIDAQIAQIGQLAESYNLGFKVESVEDLLNMPKSKEFYEYIKQRKSIPEAFKLAYFDEMVENKARAAQQTAAVNTRGKDHLTATGASRGSGAVSVPQGEMAMYRLFNPGATEAQIQAHFNRYKKNS